MPITILLAAARTATPWKNGGGITHEIIAFPQGSGLDDFLWRLSIAELRTSGAFSTFPGVRRSLAVLSGNLSLSVEDCREEIQLSPNTRPLSFSGEVPAIGASTGSVTVLNAMARADYSIRIEPVLPGEVMPSTYGATIFVAAHPLQIFCENRSWGLEPSDAFMLTGATGGTLLAHSNAAGKVAYSVEFRSDQRSLGEGLGG